MRKLLVAAAAASLLTIATAASADEMTGKIASIDAAAGTITLEDGSIVKLPATVDSASLKVGSDVKVTFDQKGDAGAPTTATMVEPAS
jgi:Cu/Ag efflux protein CusF